MIRDTDDYGSGPQGDGVPCGHCGKRSCDGYCEQALKFFSKEDQTTLYLRSIPTDLKRRFKMHCADLGITMTELIIQLMEGALEIRRSVK